MSNGGRAIIAGHGSFAEGLLSAVAQICGGRSEGLVPLSNADKSGEDLDRVLREQLERTGAQVVFTDLPAGSWTIAARRVLRGRADVVLVTGVNLAALLDFVFHGDLPAADAAQHAVDKARASIGIPGATRGP
jgi:PTS system N-acetylgalactosamine-specific IIA component